jgi:DNA-binding response OmpR family regulator
MVEDERRIAEAVAHVLIKNNYTVDLAHDGEYGRDCALSGIYDMIILDIVLPKLDGLSIISELRQAGVAAPILLLSAKGQIADKVCGLDRGADDYLAKPFHTEELLARLRALSRRHTVLLPDGILHCGKIALNPNTLLLSHNGVEVKLTRKEAQILELLFVNKNHIISKETIIEKIWGYEDNADSNRVETQISLLRKKMKTIGGKATLLTIRGAGYILRCPENPEND